MKRKQINDAVNSMLSGLELPDDKRDNLLKNSIESKRERKKGYPVKLTVCIVLALVLSSLVASSIGMPMLQIFKKWDNDIYAVQINMEKPMPGVFTAEKQSDAVTDAWGGNIAEVMLDLNACTNLPKWKPEQYTLAYEPSVLLDQGFGNEITLHYIADDKSEMSLSVRTLPEDGKYSSTVLYQHDNSENEIWVYGDIEYILLKNFQYHSLNWQENNCSVSIWGEFTRDEALKMVKSIYE